MRIVGILMVTVLASAPVLAQVQRSSNPQGVQIQGNTNIKASAENQSAIAKGEGNTAQNSTGAIKGGTQIQGNTSIQAKSKNSTAAAIGKNNAAANDVGTIGGK